MGKVFLGNRSDSSFQLHAVDTAARSRLGVRPTGARSLAAIEAGVSAALARAGLGAAATSASAASSIAPFMDWNAGLWTANLDFYDAAFAAAGVRTHAMQWPTAAAYSAAAQSAAAASFAASSRRRARRRVTASSSEAADDDDDDAESFAYSLIVQVFVPSPLASFSAIHTADSHWIGPKENTGLRTKSSFLVENDSWTTNETTIDDSVRRPNGLGGSIH